MLFTACEKDDDIYSQGSKDATEIDQILSITAISDSTITADGQTTSKISLKITQDAGLSNRTVMLSTDLGVFSNGEATETVTVDAYGNGQFQISSNKTGKATIMATLKNTKVRTMINFIPALPNDMLISADKYVLNPQESANITVALSRDPGKGVVSDPVKVSFSIIGTNADLLIIPPFARSDSGAANVALSNPFGIKGNFAITASAVNQDNTPFSRTIRIQIQ